MCALFLVSNGLAALAAWSRNDTRLMVFLRGASGVQVLNTFRLSTGPTCPCFY